MIIEPRINGIVCLQLHQPAQHPLEGGGPDMMHPPIRLSHPVRSLTMSKPPFSAPEQNGADRSCVLLLANGNPGTCLQAFALRIAFAVSRDDSSSPADEGCVVSRHDDDGKEQ